MLGNLKFQQYVTYEHQLSAAAIEYITQVRNSAPSRSVGVNARFNIVSADVSGKMDSTITVESHAERSYALQLDYNPKVLEFWEQPLAITIRKVNRRGARRRTQYTADFLLLLDTGPEVIEVKTREEAESLVEADPKNWVKKEGGYDYIPAREAFDLEFGIKFRVVIIDRRDQQVAENIRILLASRDVQQYEPLIGLKLDKLLSDKPVWRLDELNQELGMQDYTTVIQMIDSGRLAFNSSSASLSMPDCCYVSLNSDLLMSISSEDFDAFRRLQAGDNIESIDLDFVPKGKVAQKVLDRLRRIDTDEKSSSVRRWKNKISKGASKGLTPFQSLIDSDRNLSGRSSKLVTEVKNFLDYFANEVRLTLPNFSVQQAYCEYLEQAKDAHPGQDAVSRETFRVRMNKISPELVGQAKGGKRMSLAMSPPTDPKYRHLSPTLPWMKASVDHCKVNIALVVYEDSENIYVARPWLSTMVDVATSEVLAFAISFDNPSRKSCAKLMRECVRVHGKLPREIIVDHGSDFISVYFRSLLAHYRITHTLRPSANPRSGAEVERFFGEFTEQWLKLRPGFVPGLRTLRSIDGKFYPEKDAVLTVEDLYQELLGFLGWRSSKPRGASSKSTSVVYREQLSKFPFIPHHAEYDSEFVLATCVEVSDYRIDFQRGIHIKDYFFYTPRLRELQGVKSRTEVRIDPENPTVVFVDFKNKWVPAYHTSHNRYVEKRLHQRIAEGILTRECYSMRRKLRINKGVEAVGLRHEFDLALEKRAESENTMIVNEQDTASEEDTTITFIPRNLDSEEW